MKTRFTLFGIVATIIVGACALFISCNKELNDIISYHGEVVYINTTNPFPNLQVKVTDGKNTHCQTLTDDAGQFSLKVRVNEIDGNYYLLAGDSTCIPKKVALGGYGQAEVDLGTIEVEGPALPTVETNVVTSVTAEEAVCGGNVMTNGRLAITARGVCYGTEAYPTLENLHTTDGNGLGEFTSTLKNLEHNTIYYVRAYATNKIGTSYGEQVKFTTQQGVPVVVTDSIIRITAHGARCKGRVESDGGYPVTKRGACWSTYPDPTIDDKCTDNGSGKGEFSSDLTNLELNTKYYVRTYAINSNATVYGELLSFTTLDGLAIVNTNQATATATSINVSCEVVDDSGFNVIERGVCYSSTNAEPLIEDEKVEYGRGKGSYNVSIKDLVAATTYYVRAYAINENGRAYGRVLTVTTKDGMASITLGSVKDITALTASCDVKVTDVGGSTLQSCGLCWSTTPNPTIEHNKLNGGSALNTTYSCAMTDLTPATTYYVRGYAITDIATSYSSQISFLTQSGLPVVNTDSVVANSVSITGYGNVTSDAGYNITARGVCYSTSNSTPTIADGYTTAGIGVGSFSTVITDVAVSTTYYVRAYATNSVGTGYGQVVTITTGDGLPVVETTNVGENVTATTALSGGQVLDDGGYEVIARGVCWDVTPYPTINANKTIDGSGIGYFASTVTDIDLTSNNTYYIRAYATNANGTIYGNQISINKENWEYVNLPTIEFGGYTYKLYKDIGSMVYSEAQTACANVVFCGYDDWELPTTNIMLLFMQSYHDGWYEENSKPFPSGENVNSAPYACVFDSESKTTTMVPYIYYGNGEYGAYTINTVINEAFMKTLRRVRPVRKYLAYQE